MIPLLIDIALFSLAVYIATKLFRKWRELKLEAIKNEIKEAEAAYKTVAEIEKNYPNYKKNKQYVEKFIDSNK